MATMTDTTIAREITCPFCGVDGGQRIHTIERVGKQWHLAKCSSCGLHHTDPRPTIVDLGLIYGGVYHTDLRVSGGASEKEFLRKYERYWKFLSKIVKGGNSLDVGCSTGVFVKLLKDHGFQAEGIEFNQESAEWGSKNYDIPIRVGILDTVPLEESKYDLISMTDVLEHTLDPLVALGYVYRALKPEGVALITFPDILSVESRYSFALSKLLRRPWMWHACHIPAHIWEFTPDTAKALFNKAGFEVAAFQRSQIFPEFNNLLSVTAVPLLPLSLPGISNKLGTQMEFIIRKKKA